MFGLQKKQIIIDDTTIYYQTIGTGLPLVLIHGLSGSTRWWKHNIAALARNHTLYLIDLPGYGTMSRFQGKVALKQASEWIVRLLHAIGIQQADFIGHSMGGYICINIAAAHPAMVHKLILVSSIGIPARKTIVRSVIPLMLAIRYAAPTFLPILMTDAWKAGAVRLYKTTKDVLNADVSPTIRRIQAHTLLIWGKNDPLVPVSCGKVLQKRLKHARLVSIEGAGHVPMFDKPTEFNSSVIHFLESA